MKPTETLTIAEIMALDTLITVAQQRGRGLRDRLVSTEEQAQAQNDAHVAMWEARHGGLEISDRDRETLRKIRELAATLEVSPTLEQLLELRAEAVRAQRQG
jgi:hypothetical protein